MSEATRLAKEKLELKGPAVKNDNKPTGQYGKAAGKWRKDAVKQEEDAVKQERYAVKQENYNSGYNEGYKSGQYSGYSSGQAGSSGSSTYGQPAYNMTAVGYTNPSDMTAVGYTNPRATWDPYGGMGYPYHAKLEAAADDSPTSASATCEGTSEPASPVKKASKKQEDESEGSKTENPSSFASLVLHLTPSTCLSIYIYRERYRERTYMYIYI